jgi:hypothetical protein
MIKRINLNQGQQQNQFLVAISKTLHPAFLVDERATLAIYVHQKI